MTYTAVNVSSGARLKASDTTQLMTNLNDVRKNHIGNDGPNVAETGVIWLKNTSSPNEFFLYDGTEYVNFLNVDTSSNVALALGLGLDTGDITNDSIVTADIADNAVNSYHIGSAQLTTQHFDDGIFGSNELGGLLSGSLGTMSHTNLANSTFGTNALAKAEELQIAGTASTVSITLNDYTACLPYTQVSPATSGQILSRTGTSSAGTPGFTLKMTPSGSYAVNGWYFY